MTNYEWLVKNKAELVKNILGGSIGKHKGIPERCSSVNCMECDFNNGLVWCRDNVKHWLDREHEPLYKKGDIVVGPFDQISLVKKDYDDDGSIMISCYTDNTCGRRISITDIKKKIGHIDESEETDDPSLCASCKSKECILQTGIVRKHCDFYKAESEV